MHDKNRAIIEGAIHLVQQLDARAVILAASLPEERALLRNSLGDGVRVHHGTAFGVEAGGTVEVGDGSILAGVVFMCAERITLGSCVVASYNVTIADCDFHPLDPDLRRRGVDRVLDELLHHGPGALDHLPGRDLVGDGVRQDADAARH